MEAVAPEDAVVGHVQVQSYGVLLRGHHLAVVPLDQVDASDLVAVGEEQVGAFTCSPKKRGGRSVLCAGQSSVSLRFTAAAHRWTGGRAKLDRWVVSQKNKLWIEGKCFTNGQSNQPSGRSAREGSEAASPQKSSLRRASYII